MSLGDYSKVGFTDNVTPLNKTNLDKIDAKVLELDTAVAKVANDSAAAHNATYRGKSLGSSLTSAQQSAISAETFDDLFIGDYWTISSVNHRIGGCNYYLRTGSSYSFSTNHLVIVPDTNLYTAEMNDTNTTEGGYVGSKMFTENLDDARATVQAAFGSSHLLTHEIYLTNAVTNGYPSAGEWIDVDVITMNEEMYYGCPIKQQMSYGGINVYTYAVEKNQLPLFRLSPRYLHIRSGVWLRDIVSAAYFCICSTAGFASSIGASSVYGVRPAYCIG